MKKTIILAALLAQPVLHELVLASDNPHQFPRYREALTDVDNCNEAHATHREHARLLALDHCNTEHPRHGLGRFEHQPKRCRRVVNTGEGRRPQQVYQVESAVRFWCGK